MVFEETQSHKEMAEMVAGEVVSAGFCYSTEWCDGGEIVCSGGSAGLGRSVGPDDQTLLRQAFARGVKYINFDLRGFVLFDGAFSHSEMIGLLGDKATSAGCCRTFKLSDGVKLACSSGGEPGAAGAFADGDGRALRNRFAR